MKLKAEQIYKDLEGKDIVKVTKIDHMNYTINVIILEDPNGEWGEENKGSMKIKRFCEVFIPYNVYNSPLYKIINS